MTFWNLFSHYLHYKYSPPLCSISVYIYIEVIQGHYTMATCTKAPVCWNFTVEVKYFRVSVVGQSSSWCSILVFLRTLYIYVCTKQSSYYYLFFISVRVLFSSYLTQIINVILSVSDPVIHYITVMNCITVVLC